MTRAPLEENVSRETLVKLRSFEALVQKWTRHINLISRSTVPDIWSRHIVDSAQVFEIAKGCGPKWLDIGSGGGMPGIVVAILAQDKRPDIQVTLVESDQRKATFLRTAARELSIKVDVLCDRVEKIPPQNADVISARALADLEQLFVYCEQHLSTSGIGVFPKGENWQKEVDNLSSGWRYKLEAYKSCTQEKAAILKVGDIRRV